MRTLRLLRSTAEPPLFSSIASKVVTLPVYATVAAACRLLPRFGLTYFFTALVLNLLLLASISPSRMVKLEGDFRILFVAEPCSRVALFCSNFS